MSPTNPTNISQGLPRVNRISPSLTLVDGVFQGGGGLGAAYIGALTVLRSKNIWFHRVAGNSAGAILASLIAAGYTDEELKYLSGPPEEARPSTISRDPINFMSFIDKPQIATSTRRKTLLWQALNGTVLDELGEITLPIVTRKEAVQAITNALGSIPGYNVVPQPIRKTIEQTLSTSLSLLPAAQPKLKAYLPNTSNLRTKFADQLWEHFAAQNADYLKLVNLLYEGGICEGSVLLSTIESLLREKIKPQHSGPVTFNDLKMELAIIAADTTAKEMVVYATKTHGTMSVAEAVRRSMSIPLLFQPRLAQQPNTSQKHEIMDGGLVSNYPYWIFSGAGKRYVSFSQQDQSRPKLGFLLDQDADAPSSWNVRPAKWLQNGRPFNPGVKKALFETFSLNISPSEVSFDILDRMMRVIETIDRKEEHIRKATAHVVTGNLLYYEAVIPLKGFHWLDFKVNNVKDHFLAMTERGEHATMEMLKTAPLQNMAVGI
jgi:predicted acylesterase/phospholipase RssA